MSDSEELFLGLFPNRQYTPESRETLQKFINKEHTIKLRGEEGILDGISFIQHIIMNNSLPEYVATMPQMKVITYTIRTERFQKAFGLPAFNAIYYGIFNRNSLNTKLNTQENPIVSKLNSKLQELRNKKASLPNNNSKNINLIQIDGLISNLEGRKSIWEIQFLTRKELTKKFLSLPPKLKLDEIWENVKLAIQNPSIKVITIPLSKLIYYEGINSNTTSLIHHANYIVIRKAAKLWYLVEPERNTSSNLDFKDKLDKRFEHRILSEIGKRVDDAAGEEYTYDPIRVTCPQAITKDENCIWWSLLLAYMLAQNSETIDFNMLLKKILRTYSSDLPSLIESFKVFLVEKAYTSMEELGFEMEDFTALRASLTVEGAAGGGGEPLKLKPRKRCTRCRHLRKHGKQSYTRRCR
jgi:hypothetical protein